MEFRNGDCRHQVVICYPVSDINDHDDLRTKSPETPVKIILTLESYNKYIGSLSLDESTAIPMLSESFFSVCDFLFGDFTDKDHKNNVVRMTLTDKLSYISIADQHRDRIVDKIMALVSNLHMGKDDDSLYTCITVRKEQTVYVDGYDQDELDSILRDSLEEFESANYGMVPASESSIAELLESTKATGENKSDETQCCSICLDELEADSYALSMPCSHIFHDDCITKWLRASHYCPICRYEMPTE